MQNRDATPSEPQGCGGPRASCATPRRAAPRPESLSVVLRACASASTAAKASSDENGDLVLDDDISLDDGIDVDNGADDLMVDVQIKPGAVGTASATSRAAGESASGENTDNTPVIHYGVAETPEVMIVGTVDGEVHGVRVEDGEKLWTTDEVGGPTIKSFQAPSFKGGVVPGDDGQLYIFSEEEDDLSLHPLSIPDLVNSCPLTDTLGGEEGEIRVVGQRKTSYYEIDPNTGRRLRVFTSDTGSLLNGRWEIVGDSQPPELSNKDVHFPDASPLTIGRVDYHVRAYNAVSGLEVWNFTYGQFLSRDRDVPRLSSRNLEIDTAMSQRATWEGVPVTAVFGVSRAQSSKKSWRFLSEVSIGNEGQAVIGNLPKAKPIYLQRIKYKSGHVQVYATTSRPGRDIRCSNAVFPEDIGYRSSDAGVAGVAMDQEQCTVVDEDFPLQGPYHVTDQHLIYGDADDITDSPVDSGRVTKSLNLIRRHKRGSAQELEVQYDPATETERVGQLTVQLDSVLGRGCHGTTVLKGRLRDRPVAVKKVVASQFQLAKKEIDLLIRSDGHSNVVRYFTQEETREFIYLALELCDFTLEKAVESIRDLNRSRRELVPKSAKKNVRLPDTTIAFLHSLADATKHLHSLCIVHCDIKPQNILVIETKKVDAAKAEVAEGSWDPSAISSGAPGPSGPASSPTSLVTGAMTVSVSSVSASSGTLVEAESQGSRSVGGSSYLAGLGEFFEPKLSDMGLGRKFSGTTSSIYGGTSMHGSGTVGWRAPELLSSLRSKGDAELERDVAIRCGRKVDVFSMGCVFFYVVSNGFHPFGDAIEREKNIMDDAPVNLGRIKNYPEAQDLIGQMIRHDAQLRPSIEECMEHPLLWPASRKLEFLKHVSDRLELDRVVEDRASGSDPRPFSVPESTLHERFEEYAREVFGSQGWLQRLHPSLRNDVVDSKRRYYTTHSLRDLLRYMRNKYSHIRESTPEVRDLLSPLPDRFLDEFIGSNRFPKLLMSCHRFILEFCAHEPEFAEILGPFTVAKYGPDAAACAKRAKEAPAGSEKFGTLSPDSTSTKFAKRTWIGSTRTIAVPVTVATLVVPASGLGLRLVSACPAR
ncbi:Protein kinase, putative [Hondaea fermentalgiana]|uniref:non-specific serine/threonine protein kinase n=1 Tax=Hondaea fermentalgiana TaxID=2315210 RepID=A0A2R5GE26_9STRA|nr:Protein kinase, putative [Hondaea fermentalgiana]|eukprot:GBG29187.1 Protein kinase, putative [Hondaea fermentalgiana]